MASLKKTEPKEKDLESVINRIEDESMRTLNDEIYVSEDGYVHDIPLLAGYVDEEGVHHTTFTFREMNGKDEEAINKADVRSNGAKMINVLVERCVVQIGTLTKKECGAKWGTIVRSLLCGDLDYMALKIRELSKGEDIEFVHKCPNCGTKLNTVVSLKEFNVEPFKGAFEVPFTLMRGYKDNKGEVHKDGVLRIPNGFDREIVTPLFKKNSSTAMSMLFTRIIRFNDGAFVTQPLITEMSLRDREILERIITENSFGLDMNIDIQCSSCGQELSGELAQSNFL